MIFPCQIIRADSLNIGLQQNGIEYAAPETVREETLESLELFMTDETVQDVENAYSSPDSRGIRKLMPGSDMEKGSGLMALPESILFQMNSMDVPGMSLSR